MCPDIFQTNERLLYIYKNNRYNQTAEGTKKGRKKVTQTEWVNKG